MNTFLSRLNNLFAFTLSVMAVLTFLCFCSTFLVESRKSDVHIESVKKIVKLVRDYTGDGLNNDLGFMTFDLSSDLAPLFNWNVKQLFVYLTAEYSSPRNQLNQVVIWDKIILRGEDSQLNFMGLNPKYYFWDNGNGLKGNENVTLTLNWNVIPNAGDLPIVRGNGHHSFSFPDEYAKRR